MLQNFDAPTGEISCARRPRSNTPLQALTTLNEPLFVECARALASELLHSDAASDDQRLKSGFRRCVSRDPREDELNLLRRFLVQQRERFTREGANPWPLVADDDKAKQRIAGELANGRTAADLAAWTAVARVMLNLDETITKE
jgi:hypothetical protein